MPGIKAGKIRQIALAVGDLGQAVEFYQSTLGLKLLFRAEPKMAFFDCDGVRLMLSEAETVEPGGPILYFSVIGIEDAYQKLGEAGADLIRKPLLTHETERSELWLAFFKDPDGHTLGLMEERAGRRRG